MKAVYIQPSRESERKFIIDELNRLGIYQTSKGESLESQNYYNLRTMLATEQAVRA